MGGDNKIHSLHQTATVGVLPLFCSNLGRSTQLGQTSARVPKYIREKGPPGISNGSFFLGGARSHMGLALLGLYEIGSKKNTRPFVPLLFG